MKVACISDNHGQLSQVEPCDLLVIAGDICPHFCLSRGHVGDDDDVNGQARWLGSVFSDWLDNVPAKEIVLTFGNHDWVAEKKPQLIPKFRAHVLMDSGAEILGMKVWGSPFSPFFYNWAFNSPPGYAGEAFLNEKWNKIPDDTDILIVHGPPRHHGCATLSGELTGSQTLENRIEQLNLKLSVHGHIHEQGHHVSNIKDTLVCNASVLDIKYRLVRKPLYFEIQ